MAGPLLEWPRRWPEGSVWSSSIIEEITGIDGLEACHRANYIFGEVLQQNEHGGSRHYHDLDQRGKARFRRRFHKKCGSKDRGAPRRRELWKQFEDALTLDKVTRRLEIS